VEIPRLSEETKLVASTDPSASDAGNFRQFIHFALPASVADHSAVGTNLVAVAVVVEDGSPMGEVIDLQDCSCVHVCIS
jgi:hypothetical protein